MIPPMQMFLMGKRWDPSQETQRGGSAAGPGLKQTSSSPLTSPPSVETYEWKANICLNATGQEMLFGHKLNFGTSSFLKALNRQRGQPTGASVP